jgi:hypothetical protein
MRDYSVTAQQLGALVRHQRLTAYACTDRTTRFAPAELAAVFATEPEEPELGELAAAPSDDPLSAMRSIVHETTGMLKDARVAMVDILKAAVSPLERGLAFYEKVAGMQEQEIVRLRAGWMEGLVAREQLLDKQHERQLLTLTVEQEHALRKQALDMASSLAPQLFGQIKLQAAAEEALAFVTGVDDSLLMAASEMGFLPKDKLEALQKIRGLAKERSSKMNGAKPRQKESNDGNTDKVQ